MPRAGASHKRRHDRSTVKGRGAHDPSYQGLGSDRANEANTSPARTCREKLIMGSDFAVLRPFGEDKRVHGKIRGLRISLDRSVKSSTRVAAKGKTYLADFACCRSIGRFHENLGRYD